MVSITDPFFNNNTYSHDCVRVEKSFSSPNIFGVQVHNANFHQKTRSAMRLVDANVRCSISTSSPTVQFEEGALIVEGYTNNFYSSQLAGDLLINNSIVNSHIHGVRDTYWKSEFPLQNTHISSTSGSGRLNIDLTNKSSANNWLYTSQTEKLYMVGQPDDPTPNVGLEVMRGGTAAPVVYAHTGQYEFFNNDLFLAEHKNESNSGFNYFRAKLNGMTEVLIAKGGHIVCNESSGGLWLTSSNGTKYRLTVGNDGVLFTESGTPPQ